RDRATRRRVLPPQGSQRAGGAQGQGARDTAQPSQNLTSAREHTHELRRRNPAPLPATLRYPKPSAATRSKARRAAQPAADPPRDRESSPPARRRTPFHARPILPTPTVHPLFALLSADSRGAPQLPAR